MARKKGSRPGTDGSKKNESNNVDLTPAEGKNQAVKTTLVLTRMSEVKAEKVSWLWHNRIPLGKLTILMGDPGLGKSFVTLDIAARVSKGLKWPDCDSSNSEPADVLILTAEDGLADAVRPRLEAMNADLSRIWVIDAVLKSKDEQRSFCLDQDIAELRKIVEIGHVKLVIIDPITAYMGNSDSHNNADVRAVLAPLSKLAEQLKCAVIAVTHLNKKSDQKDIYRGMGSLAFIATARCVWKIEKDIDDPKKRLMTIVKNNLATDTNVLSYTITGDPPFVNWDIVPLESMSEISTGKKRREREQAQQWLTQQLQNGPVSANEMIARAKDEDFSMATLLRAKRKLNVQSKRNGKTWEWLLIEPGWDEREIVENIDIVETIE